ncbi:biotin--[acetyl-CoA-carboxylase] ligase [Mesorhizobium sp. ASY16-5R]|uniref:biotin--[acetyl-CoA-carboxylase] ligase n=1 Tax=Mesorhizobium sp. ASY16-5R TaxID=3445772 RepID=UPI003F9FBE60
MALSDVGSTNAFALECARAGEPGGLWITACRQSLGRGRRGRTWVSEEGNLYASLLVIDPAPVTRIGTLPLVAAIAVYRTLKPFFAATPQALAIKWPNDILVDGRKINGILLESEMLTGGGLAVVIGCGINCRHHPDNPAYPTTDLADCGIDVAPENLFPRLAAAMADALAQWNRGGGFFSIREEWLRAARGVREPVTVNLMEGQIRGVFEDIDADGYLCLSVGGELKRISAGDLFFAQATGTRS